MNSMMLVLAMSAGQGPPAGYQLPPVILRRHIRHVVAAPAMPGTTAQPATMPPTAQPNPMTRRTAGMATATATEMATVATRVRRKSQRRGIGGVRVLRHHWGCKMEQCGVSISGWTEGNYTFANRGPRQPPSDVQRPEGLLADEPELPPHRQGHRYEQGRVQVGRPGRTDSSRYRRSLHASPGCSTIRPATIGSTSFRRTSTRSFRASGRRGQRSAGVSSPLIAATNSYRAPRRRSCRGRTCSSTTRSRTPACGRRPH